MSEKNNISAPSFEEFATTVYPFLDVQRFHATYYRLLQAFAEGRVRRLIITMPPQHGKSVGATTLLPAYMLGLNPNLRIAIASYSASLALASIVEYSVFSNLRSMAQFFPIRPLSEGRNL